MAEEIKEELNETCDCEENCECKGKEKKSREAKKYEKKINELNEELAKWQADETYYGEFWTDDKLDDLADAIVA